MSKKESIYQINPDDQCSICFDKMTSGVVSLKCGHTMCASCFVYHMRQNNNCPYCREEICIKPKNIIKMPALMCDRIVQLNITRKCPTRKYDCHRVY